MTTNWFHRFDEFFLDEAIQPISWRIERITGMNCFTQARMLLTVFLAGRYSTSVFSSDGSSFRYVMLGMDLFLLSLLYSNSILAEKAANLSNGANPGRAIKHIRLAWLLISLSEAFLHSWFGVQEAKYAWSAIIVTTDMVPAIFAYLIACDTPPPAIELRRQIGDLIPVATK